MGRASPAIAAFVGGEFSPQMEARTDAEKYPVAAHIQQNMIALKQGPSTRRPGTAFVQAVKNSANRTWLRRFEFSQTQAFILEFGDKYVRFYANHGPLLSTGNAAYSGATAYVLGNQVIQGGVTYYCIASTTGNSPPNATFWYPMSPYQGSTTVAIYEIPSPYAVADLTNALGQFTLQISQSGDVLYIAGGNAGAGPSGVGYQPYTLTRFANSPPNWQFSLYSPTDGPYADPVPLVAGKEIAISASDLQGTVTINAWGGALFAATDVGRLIRIQSQTFNVPPWETARGWTAGQYCSNNGNNYLALSAATSGPSPPVHTSGAVKDGATGVLWLYTDSNYGVVQITAFTNSQQVTAKVLLRLPANVVGSSATITAITQANPGVVSATNTFTLGNSVFIVNVAGMTQVNQVPYTIGAVSGATVSLAGIDTTSFSAYTSGGTIIQNATVEWQLGAWSNTTEWPRANAFYKDRLWWAGKLQLWGSVPGLYNSQTPDFFNQQTTDSAVNILVSGVDASNICWLSPAIILLVGTEGGEYGVDAANYSTSPLGPANIECLRQSEWRCSHVAPSFIGTSVLYAQRAGRKIYAADYNFYLNRYDSTDQSKFAYHMTIGGITGLSYQQEPWSILWATRTDGTLLSYTFNREDQVTAWCRHNMGNGGIVESLASIPAPDGTRDEVWLIVNRTVNGSVVRTVEYMVKPFEGPQAGYVGDAQSSAWYVDCGVQSVSPPTVNITNVVSAFVLPHGGSTQYTCNNTFSVGQAVFVNGVISTGTFNANVQGALIISCTPTTFTIAENKSFGGTFNYVSGGNVSVGSGASQVISGLPAVMFNQTVAIFADGSVLPQQVVSGTGTVTLDRTYALVTVGFPYQSNLVPMRMEGGADIGTAQGKKKQGANLTLRLVDSAGAICGQLSNQDANGLYQDPLGLTNITLQQSENVVLNYTTTTLGSAPPIQSGDFPVSFPHNPNTDQDASDFYMLVQQNNPLPLTVCGLYPSYKVEEWQ